MFVVYSKITSPIIQHHKNVPGTSLYNFEPKNLGTENVQRNSFFKHFWSGLKEQSVGSWRSLYMHVTSVVDILLEVMIFEKNKIRICNYTLLFILLYLRKSYIHSNWYQILIAERQKMVGNFSEYLYQKQAILTF